MFQLSCKRSPGSSSHSGHSSRSNPDSMEGISPRRHRDGARHEEASISGSSERKPRSETKPSKTARPSEPIPRPEHPRFPASTRRVDARPGVVTEVPAASRSAVSAPVKQVQDPVEIRPRRDERTTLSEGASRYTMQCISQQDRLGVCRRI
jgi:hypothetical protein